MALQNRQIEKGNNGTNGSTGDRGQVRSRELPATSSWPEDTPRRASGLVAGRCFNRVGRSAASAIAISFLYGVVLCGGGCSAAKDKVRPPAGQSRDIAPPAVQISGETQTHVEMVNVNIHLDSALILHIHYLSGQFLPTRRGQPPAFDNKLSYVITIDSAEVGVTAAALSHALNTYVFGAPDAPLKNLTFSVQGNQIKEAGTLNKGIRIPFEITGALSATADGRLRLRPVQMKAGHLPVKGVMKLIGLDIAKLVNTHKIKGVSVEGNDMILDAAQMLPPPAMRGHITAVAIMGDEIVQTYGTARIPQAARLSGDNYMSYSGGVLQFGKLTMTNTDMKLIDADPSDPFDFFPDHYKDQLVAGYSKTTAAGGLLVYMPDYGKISKLRPPHLANVKGSGPIGPVAGLR